MSNNSRFAVPFFRQGKPGTRTDTPPAGGYSSEPRLKTKDETHGISFSCYTYRVNSWFPHANHIAAGMILGF